MPLSPASLPLKLLALVRVSASCWLHQPTQRHASTRRPQRIRRPPTVPSIGVRTWFVRAPGYFSGVYLGDDPDPKYPLSDHARNQRPVWWRLQLTVIAAYAKALFPFDFCCLIG